MQEKQRVRSSTRLENLAWRFWTKPRCERCSADEGFLDWLIALGPVGVLAAALLDGAGLPIPGGVDALVVFLALERPHDAYWLAAVAVLGSVIGNYLLFTLARRGGEFYLQKRHSSPRSQHFRKWFDRYGLLTVFVSALVPLPIMPMKIFVVCSGPSEQLPVPFCLHFSGPYSAIYGSCPSWEKHGRECTSVLERSRLATDGDCAWTVPVPGDVVEICRSKKVPQRQTDMTYRVAFAKRFRKDGQESQIDPTADLDVYLPDGVVVEKNFVERLESMAQHSQEVLDEDDAFLGRAGTEVWEYEIVNDRASEFEDALKNSQTVMEFEVIDAEMTEQDEAGNDVPHGDTVEFAGSAGLRPKYAERQSWKRIGG